MEENARLFALLNLAMADAGICAWDAKYHYHNWRPVTAIRNADTDGNPATDPDTAWSSFIGTPPFPDYVSGHSTFSSASAEVLKLFTGSDDYGASVKFEPGSSRIEPGATPKLAVRLYWATFYDAADEAGLSRRLGGIHFEDGDIRGRIMGRLIARQVWEKASQHFGTASGQTEAVIGARPAAHSPRLAKSGRSDFKQ